jgi:hypothetical protein
LHQPFENSFDNSPKLCLPLGRSPSAKDHVVKNVNLSSLPYLFI